MNARFSKQQLFDLRNKIPMDVLIREHLHIPSKTRDGVFRFLCPKCNEFQTGVNPATNLARCFRCERNFNTIDLVMEIKGCGFKDSVLLLKSITRNINVQDPVKAFYLLASGIGRSMPTGL